jgi:hypothetical protein
MGSYRILVGWRVLHAGTNTDLVDLTSRQSAMSIHHDGLHYFAVNGKAPVTEAVEAPQDGAAGRGWRTACGYWSISGDFADTGCSAQLAHSYDMPEMGRRASSDADYSAVRKVRSDQVPVP